MMPLSLLILIFDWSLDGATELQCDTACQAQDPCGGLSMQLGIRTHCQKVVMTLNLKQCRRDMDA